MKEDTKQDKYINTGNTERRQCAHFYFSNPHKNIKNYFENKLNHL